MGDVIYIGHWRAKRRARPEPRGMVSVDLELLGDSVDEHYQRGTVEESLLRQIEAGELPAKR